MQDTFSKNVFFYQSHMFLFLSLSLTFRFLRYLKVAIKDNDHTVENIKESKCEMEFQEELPN